MNFGVGGAESDLWIGHSVWSQIGLVIRNRERPGMRPAATGTRSGGHLNDAGAAEMWWQSVVTRIRGCRGISSELLLALAVSGVVVATLFARLDDSLLWDDDECRNARCSAEMLAAGDLIVPQFHGQLRTHKPVLLYWLMIPCTVILGATELAARLPSAMCGLGTAICVWLSAQRCYPAGAAKYASLSLGSSLLFVMAARAATPDSLLIFCIAAALSVYVRGTWDSCPADEKSGLRRESCFLPSDRSHWILIYFFMGLGVLAKGPVGVVLPLLVMAVFVCLAPLIVGVNATGSWRNAAVQLMHPGRLMRLVWQLYPITGIITVSLVAVPWYVAVTIATDGAWLRGFLLDHNLGRALQAMEGHSGHPLLFYPAALCVGFFPWSVLLTVLGIDFCRQCRQSPHAALPMLFGLCWAAVPVGLFSLAATQLPSYITPGYPGLALAFTPVMYRLIRGVSLVSSIWLRLAFGTSAIVSAAVSVVLATAAADYLPGFAWLGWIPVPLLIVSAVLCAKIGTPLQGRLAVCWCFAAAFFTAGLFVAGVPAASDQRGLVELLRDLPPGVSNPVYASWGTPRASWIYYTGQNLPVFAAGSEAEAAMFLEESADHLLIVFGDTVSLVQERIGVPTRVCGRASAFPDLRRHSICLLQFDRQESHIHRKLILSGLRAGRNKKGTLQRAGGSGPAG